MDYNTYKRCKWVKHKIKLLLVSLYLWVHEFDPFRQGTLPWLFVTRHEMNVRVLVVSVLLRLVNEYRVNAVLLSIGYCRFKQLFFIGESR